MNTQKPMQNFSLSYSKKYKIVMALPCLLFAALAVIMSPRLVKELFYNPSPDWTLISVGVFCISILLSAAAFLVFWIKNRRIEFDGNRFKITTLFKTNEYQLSDITSYWHLNATQPITLFFKKDGKVSSVTFENRLDPESKGLQLVKDRNINFDNPYHVKNQNGTLVIILIIFLYALYLTFDSIYQFGKIIKPALPLFLILIDLLLLRSYFLQKKFLANKNKFEKDL